MNNIPESISTKDAAESIGVSEQRVRTLLRTGALRGKQIGKQWITTTDAVAAYLRAGAAPQPSDRKRKVGKLPTLKALSFFSGALGLDLGLEQAGIKLLLACEIDKTCRRTISTNRPDIGLIGDIWKYSAEEIRDYAGLKATDDIDVIVGGPPCQAFSTAGARRGFQDERGNAFLRYVDLILELTPRFAVIENVRGLLSAPMIHTPHSERGKDWQPTAEELPGGALMHVLRKLRKGGYGVTFNLYNAANFGVPQSRERVVLVCSRDGRKLPHLMPTHSADGSFGLHKWRTLREAFGGLDASSCTHEDFPTERLRFYRLLGPGQYWKHLPQELHREAMGGSLDAGGGKTGFYRRLDWNRPSCTLVTSPTMPATDICHPTENRPLSVQEYARLQQFPDEWIFCGSIKDQYKQIGNAVPTGLGEAIGRLLISHMARHAPLPPNGFQYSRYKDTDEVNWEKRYNESVTSHGMAKKKSANSRTPKRPNRSSQRELFEPQA
jgi:DNA (cytosine-5)-methyltransferase 1